MTIPRVVIVTGTDTGVGKTVVTAALTVAWSARRTVSPSTSPLKPECDPMSRGTLRSSQTVGTRRRA